MLLSELPTLCAKGKMMKSFASSQRDALHAMSGSNIEKSDASDRELGQLAAMSDDDIDTSDIPEVTDWSRAERGRFHRAGSADNVPLYLDRDVMAFLKERAAALGIPLRDLANEMLKKDIELVRSVESG